MSTTENNTPKGQHTQGEWKISPTMSTYNHIAILSGGKNQIIIAEVKRYSETDITEEAKANAKLIASAPELLEALKEANKLLKSAYLDTDRRVLDLGIEKIIKKATE